jgi:hypothetical protein
VSPWEGLAIVAVASAVLSAAMLTIDAVFGPVRALERIREREQKERERHDRMLRGDTVKPEPTVRELRAQVERLQAEIARREKR